MGFRRYILYRIIYSVVLIFFAITFNFVLFRMMPGDPTLAVIDPVLRQEQREHLIKSFGLDKPLAEQFILYLQNLFVGNLGVSFKWHNTPVANIILNRRIWNTIILSGSSLFLSTAIGAVFGVLAARKRGSKFDASATVASLVMYSTPVFWLGLIVLLVFGFYLRLIPLGGTNTWGVDLSLFEYIADYLHHLIAPMLVLTSMMIAQSFLVMRSSILDVFTQDYMLTAEAKGLRERTILFKHALRNAILPTISLLAARTAFLISGATLTETVFAWQGLGYLIYQSVGSRDYPVLQGVFLFVSITVIIANFAADIIYARLDPRVTYGRQH